MREDALACLEAAIAAVEPGRLVGRALAEHELTRGETAGGGAVWIAAIGKAAAAMTAAASAVLGDRVRGGVVVIPAGVEADVPGLQVVRGGHPVPDEGSVRGGEAILELASRVGDEELLLCLVSGGGSALMTLPPEGVLLADVQATTDRLLTAGAGITELNTVRKHLDRLKGGRLAAATAGRVLALVLSDVVGDPVEIIASGPVTPDPSTFADAIAVLEHFRVWDDAPESVRGHLALGASGAIDESPDAGADCFARVEARVVGNNRLAAEAALASAAERGYQTHLVTTELIGEARDAGRDLAALARAVRTAGTPIPPPACLVAAGETTVTVRGRGRGGRNQELALALALAADGLEGFVGASIGTDGIDGPTDAAGAIVSGETVRRARELGLDPELALRNNDSYPFFEALGDLVVTGPTGTNVMDVQLLLIAAAHP